MCSSDLEGDEIGAFELSFGCGEAGKDFTVSYTEQRRGTEGDIRRAPEALTDVEISLLGKSVSLKILSSERAAKAQELASVASGRISADLLSAFADAKHRSMMIETTNEDTATAVRIGNSGVARSFMQLASSCGGSSTVAKTAAPRNEPLLREAVAQPR